MKTLIMVLAGALIGTAAISATIVSEKKIKNGLSKISVIPQNQASKMQSDEYKTYRAEQEKKINYNDKKIKELRSKKDKVKKEKLAAYENNINELEKRNNELRKKIMSNYKGEGKEKWESFKKEFNHDMDGLSKSFKDVFKDNTK